MPYCFHLRSYVSLKIRNIIIIYIAWWSEKCTSKCSSIIQIWSEHNKLVILWVLSKKKKLLKVDLPLIRYHLINVGGVTMKILFFLFSFCLCLVIYRFNMLDNFWIICQRNQHQQIDIPSIHFIKSHFHILVNINQRINITLLVK